MKFIAVVFLTVLCAGCVTTSSYDPRTGKTVTTTEPMVTTVPTVVVPVTPVVEYSPSVVVRTSPVYVAPRPVVIYDHRDYRYSRPTACEQRQSYQVQRVLNTIDVRMRHHIQEQRFLERNPSYNPSRPVYCPPRGGHGGRRH